MNKKSCGIALSFDTIFRCELEEKHEGKHRASGCIPLLDANSGRFVYIEYSLEWDEKTKQVWDGQKAKGHTFK
jgi:hypothetical protein